MNDMRCEHLARPAVVRQVEWDDVDVRQRIAELLDPGGVRPVAVADEQRSLVEPERVAALDRRRCLEPRGDRNAGRREVAAIASGSPRRPSFPGRSRIAPCSATSAGS